MSDPLLSTSLKRFGRLSRVESLCPWDLGARARYTIEVLHLNDEAHKFPGLLGAAISGAGSTMIAFVADNGEAIAAEMVRRIESKGAKARALEVSVDNLGRQMF